MSGGTLATYQGFPCAELVFRRSRGYAGDRCEVTILAASFPGAFDWRAAADELAARPVLEVVADPAAAFADVPLDAYPIAQGLNYEGTLCMGEDPSAVISIPGLVVTSIEVAVADDAGGPAWVRLSLADERLFWPFGVSLRWRWNELRTDGTYSRETLRTDGTPFPLEAVAREALLAVWRRPPLSRVPDSWRTTSREVVSAPFPSGQRLLSGLVALEQAADPCLELGGGVAIYKPGEGKVGYAPTLSGPNVAEIPASVISEEEGAGLGAVEEATWPAEFLIVTGDARVATVALDAWEPVLMIDGSPFYLSEELVRFLTGGEVTDTPRAGSPGVSDRTVAGGRYGLDWLRKWITLPNADLGAEGVSDSILRLFADQAWKVYRLPGAEEIAGGFYTGGLGRNAHLLPMLDRAETTGRGSRLPPTVYSFSWEQRRKRWNATEEQAALNIARLQMSDIRRAVDNLLTSRGLGQTNPLDQSGNATTGGSASNAVSRGLVQLKGLTIGDMVGGELLPAGVDASTMNEALREYRKIAKLRELGQDELAGRYERALEERIKAEDALGDGTRADAYAVAKELAGFEATAFANEFGDGNARHAFKDQFGAIAKQKLSELGRKSFKARREAQSAREAGRSQGTLLSAVYLSNRPRQIDLGAQITAADLGVVTLSKASGWLEDPSPDKGGTGTQTRAPDAPPAPIDTAPPIVDLPDPSLARFAPKPVRVLFGARVRPRVDVPGGTGADGTRERGEERPDGLNDATASVIQQLVNATTGPGQSGDFVPLVLGDDLTYYAAAFKRESASKVAQIPLADVPLDRALPIPRGWVELVPLTGIGNRTALDEEARTIAEGAMSKPERVKSATYTAIGAWPVQCDGIVSSVEIRLEQADGAPCGFTTRISVGGDQLVAPSGTDNGARRLPTYKGGGK